METEWQDKLAAWRINTAPHWNWRKKVGQFLERKANQEKSRNEKASKKDDS